MEKPPKGVGLILIAALVLIAVVGYRLIGGDGSQCSGQLSASTTDVMDQTKYVWDDLVREVDDEAGYDTKGETDHPLVGGATPASASIFRVNRSSSRSATCFDDKPVAVAKIQSTADFAPLHLSGASDNYFVVWHDVKADTWHGAILNRNARTVLTDFTFEKHWQGGGQPTDQDAENTAPPTELPQRFKDCWNADRGTRRACFAEAPAEHAPTPGMGFGLGMFPLRQGGSQPWVSCAQYGCCCGGTSCHKD